MEATALESVDDVTPAWITAVLAQSGIAVTVCRLLAVPVGNGQMGSCFRLYIGYDAGEGSDRLIRELAATEPASTAAPRPASSATGSRRRSTARSPIGCTSTSRGVTSPR